MCCSIWQALLKGFGGAGEHMWVQRGTGGSHICIQGFGSSQGYKDTQLQMHTYKTTPACFYIDAFEKLSLEKNCKTFFSQKLVFLFFF